MTARRRQSGVGMLELLAALAVGAVLLLGLTGMSDNSLDELRGQQAAYYQAQVVHAAERYMQAHHDEIKAATPTAATVLAVSLEQLRAGHFLPAGFTDLNAYQQGTCVLVRQPDAAAAPGKFDALVVTSGGKPIGDKDLAAVALHAGPGSGFITAREPAFARGASWRMETTPYRGITCAGGAGAVLQGTAADAGHLVSNLFYDGAGQMATDFLYRGRVPGRPELNRMEVALRLGTTALANAGDSCLDESGATPGLTIDAGRRELLSCDATGRWMPASSWKAPVEAWSDLPVAGSLRGDVRMVMNLSRAFTFDGAGWAPLALDKDGNLDAPGEVKARNLRAVQAIESEGTIHAVADIASDRDLRAGRDLDVQRDANVVRSVLARRIEASSWMAAPSINLTSVKVAAGACHYWEWSDLEGRSVLKFPAGTVVMDADMRPLICGQDHTFRYANGNYTPN
ncbi:shufflon protein, N-terminal constant region [Duganella sp. CF458]|uniref:shufflon system plasmid conjugative transfer pilus tip adhesin PilV n=1 Tax=Duganella sp. CF458 TaxID=1884368 RepID=UPI0008DFDEEC|nr:shufflon system plasmid conjugative transfer pilus tip adhesin PilV [Duganella sp. CF458]SFF96018.1 shufflon protein, N-terminal constant region [Duganella sp. CF458]